MRQKFLLLVILCITVAAGLIVWRNEPVESPGNTAAPKIVPKTTQNDFNKSLLSLTDPASNWVVVNKQHALNPKTYVPADLVFPSVSQRVPGNESMQLRKETATSLESMFAAAAADGVAITLSSGYRSYTYQVSLYNGYVASQGQENADTQSARPGYSEHQTGLAVDLEPADRSCELELCFGDTAAGKWLALHAYKYGFIIRYVADKQDITGYAPEPWHFRYVGTELSNEMHRTNVSTLEEFFDVSGGKTYN